MDELSWWDFQSGRDLRNTGPYFSVLLAATILKADPDNRARLERAFPEVVEIVRQRCNAPNGILPTDPIASILDDLKVVGAERSAIKRLVASAARA